MITIYANATGNAIACGETFEEAKAKLWSDWFGKNPSFGDGINDLTALDTAAVNPLDHSLVAKVERLAVAQRIYSRVA